IYEELTALAEGKREEQKQFKHNIHVCTAASCLSSNAGKVKTALEAEVKARGLEQCCKVKGVGCMGLCAAGPLVSVPEQEKMFQTVTPVDAAAIVDSAVED